MSISSGLWASNSDYNLSAVSVDAATFTLLEDKLHTLLVKRGNPPFKGEWAIPGGFVEIDETLSVAARRELLEETGLEDVYIEQLYTFGDPDRDPRMRVISVAYICIIAAEAVSPQAADDADDARWWPLDSLPDLAFDHSAILNKARKYLRDQLMLGPIAFQFLGFEFTLTELQTVYEAILNEALDKRNFRRKILKANILEETRDRRVGDGRPATLYRFNPATDSRKRNRRLYP